MQKNTWDGLGSSSAVDSSAKLKGDTGIPQSGGLRRYANVESTGCQADKAWVGRNFL